MRLVVSDSTPKSSQLEPSYKIKTCIGGWSNDTAKSSQFTETNCLNTTAWSHNNKKELGGSWLELAEVAKRWKLKFELDQIQANSSQLMIKPSGWPNGIPSSIEVLNLDRGGLRVGSTVWPGLNLKKYILPTFSREMYT